MHLAAIENDRIQAEEEKGNLSKGGRLKFYVVQPGVLKNVMPHGKELKDGAEVVVRLVLDDDHKYPGSTYWEFEQGEMRQVPW